MGKIIINQYIYCNSFESAKKISKSFEGFKFKFYGLGKSSYVYAKRFIRKSLKSVYYPYKVIVSYSINYKGEFLEHGFLDERTRRKYPELFQKLSIEDVDKKLEVLFEYQCLEDTICRDIYYYEDFKEFFDKELKSCMNRIHMYYNTGLSKHQQLVACKELMSYGIIKIKHHGMPKKRYFKFDPVAFNKLYNDFRLNSNSNEEEIETFQFSF